MSPRRYSMKSRRTSVAETRRRILEATIELHGKNGVFGTSWQDIARKADVSIGTVYKHFPSLDALVPACGELLMERLDPPGPGSLDDILVGAASTPERLRRIAEALFGFYERGGEHLELDRRERELPVMREWEGGLRDMVGDFLLAALEGTGLGARDVAEILFLFDLPTFGAMRLRGLGRAEAVETVVGMATDWIARREGLTKP